MTRTDTTSDTYSLQRYWKSLIENFTFTTDAAIDHKKKQFV